MPQRPLSSLSGFDIGDAPLEALPDASLDASREAAAPADGARRPADQARTRNVKRQAA